MRHGIVATLVTLALTGCGHDELRAELDETRKELSVTNAALDAEKLESHQLRTRNEGLDERIEQLETEIASLNTQIEKMAVTAGVTTRELAALRSEMQRREAELAAYENVMARLEALIKAGTVDIVFRDGKMHVRLPNAVLFDSGRARLRPEGRAALDEVVPAMMIVGGRDFVVAGHTDDIPIRTARFENNWELSTARALTVVEYMTSKGFPPTHIAAAGYGEHDPVASNDSEQGRALNRRMEIILVPKLGQIPEIKEMIEGREGRLSAS